MDNKNSAPEDSVTTIVAETAARIDAGRDLRKLQTKLLEQQRHERIFGPGRRRLKRKLQATKMRLRGRCHFGASARFANTIDDTYRSGDSLYFRFTSGQVVRADRAIRLGKNPVVRGLVVKAIEANAERA